MKGLISALMKEGIVSIVLLVILCLLVWFGGAYLGMDEKNRLGIIAALLGMWALMFVVQKVRAVKGAMRIEKQLKAQSGAQLAGAAADKKAEIQELRKKFDESLEALKRSKGGKSALFTLPWYVIIGPPGSGKTTALQESGLNFPASQGNAKVKGIGGTRNCDWWFTDEGILLDTAGRYTTVAEDQEEWLAFLGMIKAGRNQKPINGAIVAVGMDEILRGTPDDLDRIAKDVRNRLDELSARLQAVFPVYMMFTKTDLLPGFAEFFEDFTKDERSQVWGMSFPYAVPDKQYADIFDEETRRLHEALLPRRMQLLASERPAQKKQNIYLFPNQFSLALPRMKEFIGALFGATAFQESAILRGIYFSSGTQKGAPIDQLMARMGAALGVEAAAGADDRVEKKSFFINHLFTQIMFPDKLLARSSSAVLRKRKLVRGTVQFASVLVLALASYALINAFIGNNELIAEAETAATGVREAGDNPAKELDQLRALEALRAKLEPLEKGEREGGIDMTMRMGMYQGNKLLKAGLQPYVEKLKPMFVEPSRKRIETRLNVMRDEAAKERKGEVYQQMLDLWRVYRMIGNDLDAQPPLIAAVLKKNQLWTGNVSGPDGAEMEELGGKQLEFYATLIGRATLNRETGDEQWKELHSSWYAKIDAVLVDAIAKQLGNALWEDLAYEAIIRRASEKLEPLGLSVLLAGDRNAGKLEVRTPDGAMDPQKLLNALTQDAWDGQMKPLIDERARDLAKQLAELKMTATEEEKAKALRELHKRRHAQEWKRFLSAVYPRRTEFSDLSEARNGLTALAGDASPYLILFDRAWQRRELNMGPGETLGKVTDAERKAVTESLKALTELRAALDKFMGDTKERQRVTGHLQNPIWLGALCDSINKTSNAIRAAFPTDADGTAGADVMLRVVESVVDALRTETLAELELIWNGDGKGSGVADFWNDQCAGRYPFDVSKLDMKESNLDAKLEQVSILLNPRNGKLWEAHKLISAIQSLRFNQRPLFVFRADYDDTIRNATALTEALFDTKEDERIKVRFGVTLSHRDKLHSSSFQCGVVPAGQPGAGQPNILRWNDNPLNTKDFLWEQLDTARFQPGAKIGGKWLEAMVETSEDLDFLSHGWGLFKLMQQVSIMGPAKDSEGKEYYCTYRFTAKNKATFVLDIYLTAAKSVNPFSADIFTRLKIAKGFAQ